MEEYINTLWILAIVLVQVGGFFIGYHLKDIYNWIKEKLKS